MKIDELKTKAENTWCPGCFNNAILLAVKKAIVELVNEKKVKKENLVSVAGIGCHAKIYDYLNINAYYSLHGRALPPALGIKVANPELTVISFAGDGDTYAEGIAHFVHACRYNADLTLIVHDNQVFALTTGQATPTTEEGYLGKSTPLGNKEKPLNPIALALVSGASFVARGSALEPDNLSTLIKKGIEHPGFAFIDVLQPCLAYHNTIPFLKEHGYQLEKEGYSFEEALKKGREWDYDLSSGHKQRIPLGIFYQEIRPVFELQRLIKKPFWQIERKLNWQRLIAPFK